MKTNKGSGLLEILFLCLSFRDSPRKSPISPNPLNYSLQSFSKTVRDSHRLMGYVSGTQCNL